MGHVWGVPAEAEGEGDVEAEDAGPEGAAEGGEAAFGVADWTAAGGTDERIPLAEDTALLAEAALPAAAAELAVPAATAVPTPPFA